MGVRGYFVCGFFYYVKKKLCRILKRLIAVNIFNAFVANFLRKSLHVAPCQPKRASDTTTRFYIEMLLAPKYDWETASCRVEFLLRLVVVAWAG